jgi:hypothetical protein
VALVVGGLGCFCGLTFTRLEWICGGRFPFDSLFRWHDVGVLLSSQTVGTNVRG